MSQHDSLDNQRTKANQAGSEFTGSSSSEGEARVGDWRNSEQMLEETKQDATAALFGDEYSGPGQTAAGGRGREQEQNPAPLTKSLDEAKEQAKSAFAEQKNQAADRLGGVANALRQTSSQLQTQEGEMLAQYIDDAAGQVEKFSQYLRTKNMNDMFSDVQAMARRQPELFVAGALATGFLVGRFLKSSNAQTQQRNYPYRYNEGDYAGNWSGQPGQYGASWSDERSSGSQNIPLSTTEEQYAR